MLDELKKAILDNVEILDVRTRAFDYDNPSVFEVKTVDFLEIHIEQQQSEEPSMFGIIFLDVGINRHRDRVMLGYTAWEGENHAVKFVKWLNRFRGLVK